MATLGMMHPARGGLDWGSDEGRGAIWSRGLHISRVFYQTAERIEFVFGI